MLAGKLRMAGAGFGGLDTQNVTTGATGSVFDQDRVRGYISGYIGSIASGTSSIYSLTIDTICWDENGGAGALYVLNIPSAPNSGWTSITIGGTKTLLRADATYSGGLWTWPSAEFPGTQAFGPAGSSKAVAFN